MNNEELKHYGIPGMKWGVRRYQNPDGSLTALGRRRKGEEIDAVNSHYERLGRKHKKTLDRVNNYRKSGKRSERKDAYWKKQEDFANKMLKAHKSLANAEIKKIKKTPIKELINSRANERGKKMVGTLLLNAGGALMAYGAGIGVFGYYRPNNNYLTTQERDDAINKSSKNISNAELYLMKRDAFRGVNRRSKKK